MLTHELFNTQPGLIYRDHGGGGAPVVYLPGVHGDWTPMWNVAPLLRQRCRLVETCYPRRREWTLDDHAAACIGMLDELGIARAHLLAESFGSLVGWAVALRAPARVASIVTAGGFVCSPQRILARVARLACRWGSPHFLDDMVRLYIRWIAGPRFKQEPLKFEDAFLAVQTKPGWHTTANRLKIIYRTDLRPRLAELCIPIAYIAGARDKIVPVRREIATLQGALQPQCRFKSHLFPGAPHAILPSRPVECVEWIMQWIDEVASDQPRANA